LSSNLPFSVLSTRLAGPVAATTTTPALGTATEKGDSNTALTQDLLFDIMERKDTMEDKELP